MCRTRITTGDTLLLSKSMRGKNWLRTICGRVRRIVRNIFIFFCMNLVNSIFFHFKISTTSGNAVLCLWPFLGIWLTKATPSKQWRFTISKKVFCPWSIKANPCFYSESFLFESFLKTFCIFAIFETMFVPEGKKKNKTDNFPKHSIVVVLWCFLLFISLFLCWHNTYNYFSQFAFIALGKSLNFISAEYITITRLWHTYEVSFFIRKLPLSKVRIKFGIFNRNANSPKKKHSSVWVSPLICNSISNYRIHLIYSFFFHSIYTYLGPRFLCLRS